MQNCSYSKIAYDILDYMESGDDIQSATEKALREDTASAVRQCITADLKGNFFTYTGEECSDIHHQKIGASCAAAGNTLVSPDVIEAMVEKFETSKTPSVTERLLEALEEGQQLGGDSRGQEACAIKAYQLSYPEQRFYPVDLRVDSSDEPLTEMRRLLNIFGENERRIHL